MGLFCIQMLCILLYMFSMVRGGGGELKQICIYSMETRTQFYAVEPSTFMTRRDIHSISVRVGSGRLGEGRTKLQLISERDLLWLQSKKNELTLLITY